MRRLTVALVALALLGGCDTGPNVTANHPDMVRAIEAQGFKDVVLDDFGLALEWDGCSDSDTIVANAHATNAFGFRVKLIACSGLMFKGVTVRTR